MKKLQKILNPASLQRKKTGSFFLSLLLIISFIFASPAIHAGAEAPDKGSGAFTLTEYKHISDTVTRKYVYNTSVQSNVVCVYNRGSLSNGYLRQYGVYSVYEFYTLSADGNSVIPLSLTTNGFTETDIATGESSFHKMSSSVSSFYYNALKSSYSYPSFSITGNCPLITYFSGTHELGGLTSTLPTGKEIAFAYLKTGKILSGATAYFSNWNSRSLTYGILNQGYGANIKTSSFSLLAPKLENGVFSHNGTIYDSSTLFRKGIVVVFDFGGGNKFEHWIDLPLSVGSYDINLADFSSFTSGSRTYNLSSISFFPFVQEKIDGFIYRGNVTSYSRADLFSAGCFEEGGKPIVNLGASPDKGDGVDGSKDPADVEDGTAGGGSGSGDGDGGNHKGDMIEVPESTDILTLLRNMALNITKLPANIASSIIEALRTLPLAIANALWEFIRDPLGSLISLCTAINDLFGGIPAKIALLGVEFTEAVEKLGLDFATYIASLEDKVRESVTESGAGIVLEIAKLGLELPQDIAALGVDVIKGITQTGLDIMTGVANAGKNIVEATLKLYDFLQGASQRLFELFVPRDGYFEARFESIKERFIFINSMMELSDVIKNHFNNMDVGAPVINVPLSSTFLGNAGVTDMEINFSWFLPYRNNFLALVSAFLWFGFIFHQFFSIKHLLNTSTSAVTVVQH